MQFILFGSSKIKVYYVCNREVGGMGRGRVVQNQQMNKNNRHNGPEGLVQLYQSNLIRSYHKVKNKSCSTKNWEMLASILVILFSALPKNCIERIP